jgi:sugar fermentation stimulation protein A
MQQGASVQFTEPVREGKFLKRYKRFFADIHAEGEVITALVSNTGSLKTCLFENARCVYTINANPERKLKATLQLLQTPTGWVGVNTSLTNKLVFEAWKAGRISAWAGFAAAKAEYKISKESRLDLALAVDQAALESGAKLHFVEIKNVSYATAGVAQFPDAVTERGQKHLRDLMRLKSAGHGAELVFVVQRQDCVAFTPADHIDPEYGRLLREAVAVGVAVRVLKCEINPLIGIHVTGEELKLRL